MVTGLSLRTTKNPKEGRPSLFAMFDLEDVDNPIHAIIWPEAFQNYKETIKNDEIVFVVGRVDRSRSSSEDDGTLILDQVLTPKQAEEQLTTGVRILLDENGGAEQLPLLYDILKTYRVSGNGGGSLEIDIRFNDGKIGVMKTRDFRDHFQPEMRDRIRQSFGEHSFQLVPMVLRKSEPPRRSWKRN